LGLLVTVAVGQGFMGSPTPSAQLETCLNTPTECLKTDLLASPELEAEIVERLDQEDLLFSQRAELLDLWLRSTTGQGGTSEWFAAQLDRFPVAPSVWTRPKLFLHYVCRGMSRGVQRGLVGWLIDLEQLPEDHFQTPEGQCVLNHIREVFVGLEAQKKLWVLAYDTDNGVKLFDLLRHFGDTDADVTRIRRRVAALLKRCPSCDFCPYDKERLMRNPDVIEPPSPFFVEQTAAQYANTDDDPPIDHAAQCGA